VTKIAVIGAGNVGGNLGWRLSRSGFAVRFGVRKQGDKEKELLGRAGGAAALSSVVKFRFFYDDETMVANCWAGDWRVDDIAVFVQ
jgi:hypothetical protein